MRPYRIVIAHEGAAVPNLVVKLLSGEHPLGMAGLIGPDERIGLLPNLVNQFHFRQCSTS